MTKNIALPMALLAWQAVAERPGDQNWEQGIGFFANEEFREAQHAFEQAISENPKNSTYNLWLGLAIGRRVEAMSGLRKLASGPLVRRMRRELERAIELDESNLDALDTLQAFHLRAPRIVGGNTDEAKELAARIQKVSPARGAEAWGTYYEAVGEFENAGEQFALARQLDSESTRHLLKHASFLARRGMHTESDKLFDIAFARDPDNPKVWRDAATAWILARRRSRYPRARQLIERYLVTPDREPNPDPKSEVRRLLKRL